MPVHVKRIYEAGSRADGYRVLIDRLWPRGMKKEDAHIDEWLKEIAPSSTLRKWFDHDPAKWESFQKKYLKELNDSGSLEELRALAKEHRTMTLLYAAKDEEHNHAIVLQELLRSSR